MRQLPLVSKLTNSHSAINVIEDFAVDNAPERETPETSPTQKRKPWYWEPKKLTLRIGYVLINYVGALQIVITELASSPRCMIFPV